MRDSKRNMHRALKGLLTGAFVLCAASTGLAQAASNAYKGTPRDPFTKYKPPIKKKSERKVVAPIQPPPIQERIERYKAQKLAAMNLQQPAPKPTTALLLGEVQVIGIFRTPRGFAAMVEATPIKLSYVVYPGEPFYDGMLVAIEETRLVFRRQTRWTDGRVEVAVEPKALRQPSAADALTAARSSAAAAPQASDAPAAKAEQSTEVDKLKAEIEKLKAQVNAASGNANGNGPGKQ
jgi:hypothetical protein